MGAAFDMKLLKYFSILVLAKASCKAKKQSWQECREWASFMPGAYWTWGPDSNNCLLKKDNKDMVDENGWHSGDHEGNHHWKNKKIKNGACESCAPGLFRWMCLS